MKTKILQKHILRFIMSLLGRFNLLLFLFVGFLNACKFSDNNGIGKEIRPNGIGVGSYYTDSLGVTFSQVITDTIFTKSGSYLAVGGFSDPSFGSINAKTFLNFGSSSSTAANTGTLDSVVLIVPIANRLGSTSINGPIANQTIFAYKATSNLTVTPWYTKTALPNTDPVAIGSATFVPNFDTLRAQNLRIVLNADYANQMFEFAQNYNNTNVYSSTAKADTAFWNLFPGIVLSAGENPSSILNSYLGSTKPRIVMYYRDINGNSLYSQVNFKTTSNSSGYFTNLTNTFTNPVIASLTNANDSVLSSNLNNQVKIAAGFNLAARVKINHPHLIEKFYNTNLLINKAELELSLSEPVDTLAGKAPPVFFLYEIDAKGNVKKLSDGATYAIIQNDGSNYNLASNPQSVSYDYTSKTYKVTLTDYVQAAIVNKKELHFLIVAANNPYSTRVTLDTKSSKLKMYYSILK